MAALFPSVAGRRPAAPAPKFTASQHNPLRPLALSPPVRRCLAPGGRGGWWCLRGFAELRVSRMPSERLERSPMSRAPSLRRRLLVAFAGAMLLLGAMSAAARTESYGELGHFGEAGTGPG